MTCRGTCLIIAGLALAGIVLRPAPASASCAAPASLTTAVAAAPVVFVGTVTALDNRSRVATVRVEDVWKGQGIPAVVLMVGTPDPGAAATSVDRSYIAGQQYLFIPANGAAGRFEDNSCTLTQPYSASVGTLRPLDAMGPPPDSTASAGRFPLLPVGAVLAALVVVLGLAAFRFRRGSVSSGGVGVTKGRRAPPR